jgi:hypothetical protein
MKRVEDGLSAARPENQLGDRFLARWRGLVSLISVARILGTYDYSAHDLVKIELNKITKELVADVWQSIQEGLPSVKQGRAFRNQEFAIQRCKAAAASHNLEGLDCVGKRQVPSGGAAVDEAFLQVVSELVSKMPGGANDYKAMARELGCNQSRVKSAVYTLRRRGTIVAVVSAESAKAPPD